MGLRLKAHGGVEFHSGTRFTVLCGTAIFTTHDLSTGHRVTNTYRVTMHPDGWEIDKQVPLTPKDIEKDPIPEKWDTIKHRAHREDVLALLPTDQMQWTWRDFFLALTFFDFGEETGYERCEQEQREHELRQKAAKLHGS